MLQSINYSLLEIQCSLIIDATCDYITHPHISEELRFQRPFQKQMPMHVSVGLGWKGHCTFLMLLMVSFRDTGNLRKIPVGSRKSMLIAWSPSFSHSSCIPYFPGGMVTASHLLPAPLLLTRTRAGCPHTEQAQPGLICPLLTSVPA